MIKRKLFTLRQTSGMKPYKQAFAQLGLAAILCLAVPSLVAQTTIYFDDFNGEVTADLHGTTPDTTSGSAGGTSGATWLAGGNLNASGMVTSDLGGTGNAIGMGVALLPFVPQYGYRYTLSAEIIGLDGNNNRWMGIGFTRNLEPTWAADPAASGTHWTTAGFDPVLWSLSRTGSEAPSFDQYFVGPVTGGAGTAATKSADTLKIILDTSGANWVVIWLFNDTVGYTNSAVVPDWNIKYVGFDSLGGNEGQGIDNFMLAAEVLVPDSAVPLISVQPVGFTNYVGNSASLSVLDVGTRPMSYKWYLNDLPLAEETGPSLIIPTLAPSNSGQYYVVLTNIAGAATSSVVSGLVLSETNVISPSISIVKLPATGTDASSGISTANHYLCALDFGSVIDPVMVNGVPFQQLNPAGRGLGPYFARPLFLGRDDTYGGTWALSGAFPAVTGGFAVGTGAHATADGDFAALMNDLLSLSTAPSNSTLTVLLGGLTPGQSYSLRNYYRKWTTSARLINVIFNGQGSNETCQVDMDLGGAFSLNYDFIAASNTVTMTCESTSANGPHLYALTLQSAAPVPAGPPVMVVQPQGATNWLGTSYVLNIQASGTPPLSYQWYKDGVETFGTDSSVTLFDYDAGSHQVVVANAYGSVTSQVAVVAFVSGEMPLSPSLSLVQLPNFDTDAASGIWPTNKYLVAMDLSAAASSDPLTINGVDFQQVVLDGIGTGPNIFNPVIGGADPTYGGTWLFSATNRTPTTRGFVSAALGGAGGQADGNMMFLMEDMGYNHVPTVGDPTLLQLSGLTPGAQYSLRYYFRRWSDPATGRVITFLFDGQGPQEACDVNIDMGGAHYLRYNFTAARTEVAMSMTGFVAAGAHVYAVTLQEVAPAVVLRHSKLGTSLTLSWDEGLVGYTLESTDQLPGTSWAPVGGVVNNSVTVDASTGARFYRLHKQQ